MTSHPVAALSAALADRAPAAGCAWLTAALAAVSGAPADQRLAQTQRAFAAARRQLGETPLGTAGPILQTPCGPLSTATWPAGDAGRACLLSTALAAGSEAAELVTALVRGGDEGERAAIARCLCLLPAPAVALPIAREIGRTNSLALYAALALDNPYPAACYAEHDFNQVVLKCLFNGLPIGRVVGLAGRANPRLSALCEAYHDERVAAGRPVPADLWLALVPYASARGQALAAAARDGAQRDGPR